LTAAQGPGAEEPRLPKIAVIIPARNEADNISGVILDIHAHIPAADIIIVDDHSDDGTAQIAAALPGVTVLSAPISLGIGGAVQLGLKYAVSRGYDAFLRMDGDGQHRAESARGLLEACAPRTLVQGSRPHAQFAASSNWIRKLGSLYFHLLFRTCTARDVPDPTSGLMCFGRDIAEKFSRFYPTDFPEIESLVLLIRSGHRVVASPVVMEPRHSGASSINPIHACVYMVSVTLAFFSSFLRKNPYATAHAAA
jgi:glycosyltransferase involved in cell wall biosynthesis